MHEGNGPTTVFLLDDHEVVRHGVAALVEREDDLTVVGEAGSVAEALQRIPLVQPQVAVLDVQLGDGSGIEVCREIRSAHPEIFCLMLTSFTDEAALLESVLAGASGHILKRIRGNDLVESIRVAATGRSLLDPAVIERANRRIADVDDRDPLLGALTKQERKILSLLADGLTNRQIGEQLFLAEKTVKNYVSNLLMKMGMKRRTEAAVYAARNEVSLGHDT